MSFLYDVLIDVEFGHLDQAVDFLEGEFGDSSGKERWTSAFMKWKLSEINPAGAGILAVAIIDGKVIGTASLTKKRMLLDGVEVVGGEIGDTYSAEKIRRLVKPLKLIATDDNPRHYINKSIFGRLVSEVINAARDMDIDYIYGTPNQNSLPGYVNKLNFSKVIGYKNLSRSRPTSLFLEDKIKFPMKSSKLFIAIISKLSSLYRSVILKLFRPEMLVVKKQFPTDDEMDKLWKCSIPERGFSLVKDAEYYNYRFVNNPLETYNCHSFFVSGNLSGIVITRIQKDEKGNSILVICDYLFNKNIKFCYLLNYIIETNCNEPITKFNFWCESWSKSFFEALFSGFIGGSEVPIIYFYFENAQKFPSPNLDMDFHISSSDNI